MVDLVMSIMSDIMRGNNGILFYKETKMILIDGVKYFAKAPLNEDALEQVVREHSKEIFGLNSHYFEKKKLSEV